MINIKPLKAFTDNYIWLLETNEGVSVVDPGDAGPVINYLDQNNLSDEIEKLNNLLKDGVITQEEFEKAKKKLLDN